MRLSWARCGQAGALLGVALQLTPLAGAITLDPEDAESYKQAAKTAAEGLKDYYSGTNPGVFDSTEYPWWIVGGMFMELIEYANLTGDTSWNSKVKEGLLAQIGPDQDFRPEEQFYTEANDDQLYWGMAAMTAAEFNFDAPSSDQPSWLSLAQAVFNRVRSEWNSPPFCNGGFRWQYNKATTNSPTYKNSPTNAGFFELAGRLAAYTGNQSYAAWAEKTYDWMSDVKIIEPRPDDSIWVHDGVNNPKCDEVTEGQWSYNYGAMIAGSAYLYRYYNADGDNKNAQLWASRAGQMTVAAHKWFWPSDPQFGNGEVMAEWSCELAGKCDVDQVTFKGYTARWLTLASFMVPLPNGMSDQIQDWLKQTSIHAAKQCSGGGNVCGVHWYQDTFDGLTGPGQQMSAMSLFANNIVRFSKDPEKKEFSPLTTKTGGNSESDPSAGTGPETVEGAPDPVDDIWDSVKTPVIASVCVVLGLSALVAGYFIWKKCIKKPKGVYQDVDSSQNYYAQQHGEMTPTLPNVHYER